MLSAVLIVMLACLLTIASLLAHTKPTTSCEKYCTEPMATDMGNIVTTSGRGYPKTFLGKETRNCLCLGNPKTGIFYKNLATDFVIWLAVSILAVFALRNMRVLR